MDAFQIVCGGCNTQITIYATTAVLAKDESSNREDFNSIDWIELFKSFGWVVENVEAYRCPLCAKLTAKVD